MKKLTRKQRKDRAKKAAQKRWRQEKARQKMKPVIHNPVQEGSNVELNVVEQNEIAIVQKAIEEALAGDREALKLCFAHLQRSKHDDLVKEHQDAILQKL